METRPLGMLSGLPQLNVAYGYAFEAHVFQKRGGLQHDLKLRHGAIQAPSAMHDHAQAILAGLPLTPESAERGRSVMTHPGCDLRQCAQRGTGAPLQITT